MNVHRSGEMAKLHREIRGGGSESLFQGGQGFVQPLSSGFIKKPTKKRISKKQSKEGILLEQQVEKIQEYANKVNEQFKRFVNDKDTNARHMNMLIVLDDVIGDIKELEHNAAMTKLFLNRRHLLANGTISIVLASQKYTLIPSRLRTNANQVIAFRLNPKDMEKLKEDQIDVSDDVWQQIH